MEYTAQNPYARFEDGRPKVPDELLAKCKDLSAEEVWAVLPGEKFRNQYEGNWQILRSASWWDALSRRSSCLTGRT